MFKEISLKKFYVFTVLVTQVTPGKDGDISALDNSFVDYF